MCCKTKEVISSDFDNLLSLVTQMASVLSRSYAQLALLTSYFVHTNVENSTLACDR